MDLYLYENIRKRISNAEHESSENYFSRPRKMFISNCEKANVKYLAIEKDQERNFLEMEIL